MWNPPVAAWVPRSSTTKSAGAGEELSAGEAEKAWRSFRLRPRVLRDVSAVDLTTELLGSATAAPLLVALTAFQGLAHPEGECATVAGAAAAGCLTVISTRASRTLEDIGAAAAGPRWFQAYAMRDRGLTEKLVVRAARAGARAVVLTVDTPYVARKRSVGAVRIPVPDDHFLIDLARHLPRGRAPGRPPSRTLR
jgi:4-hydroxymandelate oxidase